MTAPIGVGAGAVLPTSLCIARHYGGNRRPDVTRVTVGQAKPTKRSERDERRSARAAVA
jgi:hypothetical protein